MRFSCFAASLLAGALTLAGCGPTEVTVDGGPPADAGGPSGRLALLSEPSVSLVVGEEAMIEVRYTEADAPVPDREIRFALEGTAHDSTVAELALRTDAEGVVRTAVLAGTIASAFRVRVSADRTAPVYVNVSVGTEGFGTLRVSADYDGRRAEDGVRRVFRVYSGISCAPEGGYPSFADRAATLEDPEELDVRWSLPVGLEYAVVAELVAEGGAVIADGCEDAVTLTADAETVVEVTLRDAPLDPMGRYATTLELRPTAAAATVVGRGLDAGVTLLADAGAAPIYLGALEAELRERGEDAAADALAADYELSEASLGARLDVAALGPGEALTRFGARVEARLAVIRLGGPLTLTPSDATLGGIWTADALAIGVDDPDSPPPLAIPIDELDVAPAPTLALDWRPEADLIDVSELGVTLRLGALVSAVIDDWVTGADTPGMLLLDGSGCDVVQIWASEDDGLDAACDASCVEAACLRALDPLVPAVREAMSTSEAIRDTLRLEGSLAMADDDGDLMVDRLEGRGLTGTWGRGGALPEGDPISGDLVGARE